MLLNLHFAEVRINAAREAASEAKKAYEEAVVRRSQSQREVNELLQRKSNWTDGDVGRFTTLVREDHLFEQNEVRAKEVVTETDAIVDRELNELLRVILARYHEEQVWSDKIRSASTYGSMAALGLNLIVFMVATLAVEPWKRRRLAQTFENKVDELSVQTRQMVLDEIQKVNERLMNQERMIGRWRDDQSALVSSTPAVVVDESAVAPLTLLEWISETRREVTIALGAVLLGLVLGTATK
jgi:sensitive to high expression protein 9, mitochondrial